MQTIPVFDASQAVKKKPRQLNLFLKKKKNLNQPKNIPERKSVAESTGSSGEPQTDQKKKKTFQVSDEKLKKIRTEASQELLKEEEKNEKKLDELVERSQMVLLDISSVFPFDFFPDNITIDMNKVNIVKKHFFGSGRVHSIYIKDVADVFVESTPFFATLKIVDSGFVENTVDVSYLRRKEAHTARRIIQGLVVASKEGIDLSTMPTAELRQKIEKLGIESETKI